MPTWKLVCFCIFASGSAVVPVCSQAATVDLSSWTAESYPAVSGFNAGVWTVSGDNSSVLQSVNGQPTMFYSDFNAAGTDISGSLFIDSNSDGDDDYVGFAIGFEPGDSSSAAAEYLLIDWKQDTQVFNFASPSTTPGSTAFEGLAVSRVTGVPTADEFWGHVEFDTHPGGAVEELDSGATLGATGWEFDTTYEFRFVFTETRLQVYVDDVLQLDVSGDFPDGRFAFYNFSQEEVRYSAFELDPVTGVCGDFNGDGSIVASDALNILRTSVGSLSCLLCVCDTDGSGDTVASDALRDLRYAVDLPVTLNCPPCGGQ
jgi:hypothetical protein